MSQRCAQDRERVVDWKLRRVNARCEPKVKDNWDDEDDEEGEPVGGAGAVSAQTEKATKGTHTPEKPNWAVAPSTKESPKDAEAEGLVDKLEKLEVR